MWEKQNKEIELQKKCMCFFQQQQKAMLLQDASKEKQEKDQCSK